MDHVERELGELERNVSIHDVNDASEANDTEINSQEPLPNLY